MINHHDPSSESKNRSSIDEFADSCNEMVIQSVESIWLVDKNGYLRTLNSASLKLFDVPDNCRTYIKYNIFQDAQIVNQGLLPDVENAINAESPAEFIIEYDLSQFPCSTLKHPNFKILRFIISPVKRKNTDLVCYLIRHDDITSRQRIEENYRLNEARLEALLKLNSMTRQSIVDITEYALEQAIQLTGSKIGYLAFVDDEQTTLTMHSWSKAAMKECYLIEKQLIYKIDETGLWGEAFRQRKPIITNDYDAPNPMKKGYPEGHVKIYRHMNVPVFDGDIIKVIAGVGNKEAPYDDSDVRQLTLMMDGVWSILKRKEYEERLSESEANYRAIFDAVNDVILVVDMQTGSIVDANLQAVFRYGLTADELKSMRIEDISKGEPPYTQDDAMKYISLAAIEGPQLFEWIAKDKYDNEFWVEVNLKKAVIGGIERLIAVVRDISERKLNEEKEREVEAHKRNFYRKTILAATEGKLEICDREDIERISGQRIGMWQINEHKDISQIRHDVRDILKNEGMDPERIPDFVLCVGEATTNAIKHADEGTAYICRSNNSMIFVVSDRGHGIDALSLPDVALKRGYTTAVSLEMGYKEMISIADKVYLATGPAGTTVGFEMGLQYKPQEDILIANLKDSW